MGSNLSTEERRTYLQVKLSLFVSKSSYRKSHLKDFIKWASVTCPWLNEDTARFLRVWDKVEEYLVAELKTNRLKRTDFAGLLIKIKYATSLRFPSSFNSFSPPFLRTLKPYPKPARGDCGGALAANSKCASDPTSKVQMHSPAPRTRSRGLSYPSVSFRIPFNSRPFFPSSQVGIPQFSFVKNGDGSSRESLISREEERKHFPTRVSIPLPPWKKGNHRKAKMAEEPRGTLPQCGTDHLRHYGSWRGHFNCFKRRAASSSIEEIPSHLTSSEDSANSKSGHFEPLDSFPLTTPPNSDSSPEPPLGGGENYLVHTSDGRNTIRDDLTPLSSNPSLFSSLCLHPSHLPSPDPVRKSSQIFSSLEPITRINPNLVPSNPPLSRSIVMASLKNNRQQNNVVFPQVVIADANTRTKRFPPGPSQRSQRSEAWKRRKKKK